MTHATGSPRTGYGNVGLFMDWETESVCPDFLVELGDSNLGLRSAGSRSQRRRRYRLCKAE